MVHMIVHTQFRTKIKFNSKLISSDQTAYGEHNKLPVNRQMSVSYTVCVLPSVEANTALSSVLLLRQVGRV